MPLFQNLDDLRFAIKLAKGSGGGKNLDASHPGTSEWNEDTVVFKDRAGEVLFEMPSSGLIDHMNQEQESKKSESSASSQTPKAARIARSILRAYKAILLVLCLVIGLVGVVSFFYLIAQGSVLLGFVNLFAYPLAAFVLYWASRLLYVAIEILADISEDLRIIRLSGGGGLG